MTRVADYEERYKAFMQKEADVVKFLQDNANDSPFFQNLLSGFDKWGSLTDGQLNAVKRVMARNLNAPLPEKGQKQDLTGVITQLKIEYEEGWGRGVLRVLRIDFTNGKGIDYRVKIRYGTKMYDKLHDQFQFGLDDNAEFESQGLEVGKRIDITATVAWAKHGLVVVNKPLNITVA